MYLVLVKKLITESPAVTNASPPDVVSFDIIQIPSQQDSHLTYSSNLC
jgi:hypothetical protein